MAATGVRFEKSRVEFGADTRGGGWIYRMEPPLDTMGRFETMDGAGQKDDKVRYAVRQILDAEFRKESLRLDLEARKRRGGAMGLEDEMLGEEVDLKQVAAAAEKKIVVKKDFFGRVVAQAVPMTPVEKEKSRKEKEGREEEDEQVWVSFHEGFSNAVRKPITMSELLGGL
ncbi:ATPase AAA+ type core [Neofusicoccum parvum]|uniref:ATPase AAA+ type core n=1 Tax=Neofusicoccum parvum TaxID=310453 RepID=A0ACB5SM44_9PEZI|nr:ATPase AAA+ type core [Neofusicoccum parvum]